MARPKTYQREDVLRKATELFARKGFEGAHLQELVEVTGLNRFSLYKEFGGKEGLFQAALDGYIERLAELTSVLQREPAGLENVRAFYALLLGHEFPHGCLAVNTIREKHVIPAYVYATVERFALATEAAFLRNLTAARQQGQLAPDADVVALSKFLTALDMGLMSYGIVAPDDRDRARIVGMIERVLR
jgi:TetR/AcrR family transcriptional repressor of nem operon